jgi:replicative DNA helicase
MSEFEEEIEFGRRGGYQGLKGGLPKFDKFTNGIQKANFTVVGAQQKTGKTAFVDHRYIIQPFLDNPDANVNWIYFSYEISKIEKMAKFCAYFVELLYGDIIDSNVVLSRGDNHLDGELYEKVKFVFKEYVNPLFEKIDFQEDRMNPTGIYKHLLGYAEQHGEFVKESYVDNNGRQQSKIVGYKENDESLYTIIVLDHVGLMRREKGLTKKDNIDKMSSYFVWMRNICKFSPVVLSQFNRDLGKTERLKFSGEMLQPTMEDFKDTGALGEDASLVIALFNPTLYPHIKKHLGYDLKAIGKGYRSAHILASRNTESGVNIGLNMIGETGKFTELERE